MRTGTRSAYAGALALFVLIVSVLCGACGSGDGAPATWDIGPFKQHFAEYAALADAPKAATEASSFSGKVIFFDPDEKWIAYTYIEPLIKSKSALLAYTPEEVGAVVLVRYKHKQVGHYGGGGKAYTTRATMTVVDPARKEVVATKSWNSGAPPMTVELGWDGFGPLPTEKMLQWVEGLARQ